MRVLFTSSYWPPSIGGSQRYVSELAWGLVDRHDWEVTAVTATDGPFGDGVDSGGVRVVRLPFGAKLSNTPVAAGWYRMLRALIAEVRPDVVNVHMPVPYLGDLALTAGRHLPRVVTYHNGTMLKDNRLLDIPVRVYERYWLSRILNRADAVITCYPQFVRRHSYRDAGIFPIAPSVDPAVFHPLGAGDAPPDFDVLFVGRMEAHSAWKGVPILLRAVAAAAARGTRLRLGLAGDGDAVAAHRIEAERLGIALQTCFLGSRTGPEMAAVYRRSRALVLPSTSEAEAFGIVLIEAMASGLPVVGSDVGGIPNVVEPGRTGLLVPPGDVAALADALIFLHSDPDAGAGMGVLGRRTAVERYSPRAFLEANFEVLSRVANREIVAPHRAARRRSALR